MSVFSALDKNLEFPAKGKVEEFPLKATGIKYCTLSFTIPGIHLYKESFPSGGITLFLIFPICSSHIKAILFGEAVLLLCTCRVTPNLNNNGYFGFSITHTIPTPTIIPREFLFKYTQICVHPTSASSSHYRYSFLRALSNQHSNLMPRIHLS